MAVKPPNFKKKILDRSGITADFTRFLNISKIALSEVVMYCMYEIGLKIHIFCFSNYYVHYVL